MGCLGCFKMHSGASPVVAISILLLLLGCQSAASSVGSSSSALQHQQTRKLLNNTAAAGRAGGYMRGRTSTGGCSDQDVEVYQNTTSSTNGGIPIYSVKIINVCTGCTVYNVHVSCGNFTSTELVNPALFRRLRINDCLVNNGSPMGPGDTVSFEYSNSFAYPLISVASVSCRSS